jgi:hypothetical protein
MSTDAVHLVKDPEMKRRLARGGSWDVRKSWLARTLLMPYLGAVTAERPVVRRLPSPLALRWGFGPFLGFLFWPRLRLGRPRAVAEAFELAHVTLAKFPGASRLATRDVESLEYQHKTRPDGEGTD